MLDDDERYDDDEDEVGGTSKPEAIFTCKFPGCTRTYASTDGAWVSPIRASRLSRPPPHAFI